MTFELLVSSIAFFWLPIISAMVTLLLSICYLAYVLLWKFEYSRVPSPSSIISYVDGHPDSSLALQDGLSGLLKEYSDSVDYNFMQNQHRKSKLLLAQRLAFISFSILILCIPQWVINFSHNERQALPVQIVSPVQIIKESKCQMPQPDQNQYNK